MKGLTRNLGHGAPTTMVKILLWVYAFGGSFTLEHPRGDSEGSMRWSIWRSAFMKQLLQAADMKLITFLQGPLGQCFPKPTTLLAARLPGLAEQLFSEYDFTWRAMEWLGGKTGNVWRTAKAKVYPMKLCKVLAAAHMQHASTLCLEGFEPLPPHLHAVLDHLTQIHDPFDVEAGGMQRVGTKLW